jgi:hypothetical protein
VALLWGALSGDWGAALGPGIFFELFTLDILAVGTFAPPNALFSLLWVLCVGSGLDISQPGMLGVLIVFSLPLMRIGLYMEKRHLAWQVGSYTQVLEAYRKGHDVGATAGKGIRRSLRQLFLVNGVLFVAAGAGAYLAYAVSAAFLGHVPRLPWNSWGPFWIIGSAGAFLAIRTKPGYAVFAILALGVTAYAFFGDAL